MNKKIIELAIECGLRDDEVPYHLSDYTKYEYPQVTLFARRIIEECERLVEINFDECEPWLYPGDLLKNFGFDPNEKLHEDNISNDTFFLIERRLS